MLFTIQKENIYNGLNDVVKATSVKSFQPVLANVLIETIDNNLIKLCATDLDISIELKTPAIVLKPGSITLPAKKLIEIISKLPDKKTIEFSLNTENNLTVITCGKSKFDVFGISSSEFPAINYPESDKSIDIDIQLFAKAVKQTAFAAATYDTNNVLSGVFFKINANGIEMAATDGNRLARIIEKTESALQNTDNEYSVIIPSKTLIEFSRILSGSTDKAVKIVFNNSQILFQLSDTNMTSRLLEGQYPKYKQLIPESYNSIIKSDRDHLLSALDRTATMVNDKTSIIKCIFNENILNLSADAPDLGDSSDQIDVEYDGEEINIAFNYRYVMDSLKVMDSEKVKIELGGPLSPALFKPDSDEDYLCLVMPVQVK